MLPIPESPDDAQVLYGLIKRELERTIIGREDLVRRLAVLGVRHLDSGGGRVVLRGEPGSGATYVVETFAQVLELMWVRVPLADLAETNWRGRNLGDYFDLIADSGWRGIVHLDGLDSLPSRHSKYGAGDGESTRGYHEGKQRSLVELFAKRSVPMGPEGKTVIYTDRMTVFASGHLPGLPDRPVAEDYVDAGFVPELATQLAAATHYRIEPLAGPDIEMVLIDSMDRLRPLEELFGYKLDVDPSVLYHIARQVEGGLGSLREGIAWLEQSAEAAVHGLLEQHAPPGTKRTLALDDLRLPEEPKGRWVE